VKKYLLPVGAGVVIFGAVTAFAASLNVSSTSLGAGNATVNACTSDAKVSYATSGGLVSTATVKTYDTDHTTLTTTCNGMSAEVTLTDTNGTVLGTKTGTITNSSTDFDLSAANVDPAAVTGVSVVITG
jgi:hypothetical protein